MHSAESDKSALSARQIARRLVESRPAERATAPSSARRVADACVALNRELSRWVGQDGTDALFSRALAEVQTHSAVLDQISFRPGTDPCIEFVAETIASAGDDATAAALESVLIHLIELLTRLIGEDTAGKLIERAIVPSAAHDANTKNREES